MWTIDDHSLIQKYIHSFINTFIHTIIETHFKINYRLLVSKTWILNRRVLNKILFCELNGCVYTRQQPIV